MRSRDGGEYLSAQVLARRRAPPVVDLLGLGSVPDVPLVLGVHGPPGAGKTTLLLSLADQVIAVGRGPVLFCSIEEGMGDTLREKLVRLEVRSAALYVTAESDIGYILGILERTGARWLMVDSAAVVHLGIVQVDVLKRGGISVAFALHERKDGDYAGPGDYGHLCDVLVRVEAGCWTQTKNRFGPLRSGRVWEEDTCAVPSA
jgi:predicted ATP-dependent serine protease